MSCSRLVACGIYYVFWIDVIPRLKGYQYRQTVKEFEDGTVAHQLVKVGDAEIERWDAEHDAAGRVQRRVPRQGSISL